MANGNCCCGRVEKGRMAFANDDWSSEWERRRIRDKVHLTFTGCLGPCAVGNNALLQLYGESIWFKDLNGPAFAPAIFDYIERMLAAGHVLPVPGALTDHVYQRYLPIRDGDAKLGFAAPEMEANDLDGLDPVCLMSVDPATAPHLTEYEGRTIAFCAASCKRKFLADPTSFITPQACA
ncbi:MAG: YHS domain-containing protein [Actinobacteria bacterium]|nr:YHS domain-containing protein [Actinomycetota bacterium]